jgi:hypothetical protein
MNWNPAEARATLNFVRAWTGIILLQQLHLLAAVGGVLGVRVDGVRLFAASLRLSDLLASGHRPRSADARRDLRPMR